MDIIYSSLVNILGVLFICTSNLISTFSPIINYNEVGNLQEVQMNVSSNMWVEWQSHIVKG